MIQEPYINLIVVLHFIFILFVVLTPFIGNNYFLILHAITVPFMMAHWYLEDNRCALTMMEKKARHIINGVEPDQDDCFMYNLIAPVYDFNKKYKEHSMSLYIITIVLWLITLTKLYENWKNGKLRRLEHIVMY